MTKRAREGMGQSRTLYREDVKSDIGTVIGWQRPWAKDGQRMENAGIGDGEAECMRKQSLSERRLC